MEGADNRIREFREARGWSERELAKRSGLNFNTIHRLEHGVVSLNVQHMRVLARAFDVKPSQLLNYDDVEVRADEVGIGLVQELERIPESDRAAVLTMSRELVRIVRNTATAWSTGALEGAPEQIGQLADIWNGLDDQRRDRAIALLRVSGLNSSNPPATKVIAKPERHAEHAHGGHVAESPQKRRARG